MLEELAHDIRKKILSRKTINYTLGHWQSLVGLNHANCVSKCRMERFQNCN